MGMAGNFIRISTQQLEQLNANSDAMESFADELFDGGFQGAICDVDKSWQTIHYLLSGEAWGGSSVEAQAIMGGTEIGPDLGYGPARYLTAEQVKQIASALNNISQDDLSKRFDPETMATAGLYAFDIEYAQDELEMANDYFDELKRFYQTTADENNAMLLVIT